MRYKPVVGIQPDVLRWARLTVGLDVAAVARRLKRKTTEIESWENGTGAPTYPQLEKLAYEVYKRPLAVFFLPAPPTEAIPQKEFRTLPEADMLNLEHDTYLQIRRAHAYQLALYELFDGHNPAERRIWEMVRLTKASDVPTQARKIRDYLGVSLKEQIAWRDDEHALKGWRSSIESSGVFVFKAAFKQKSISGFCLLDSVLPVVYLNNSNTKTRQIFSLLHELAHLLHSINGLSKFDLEYIERLPAKARGIERFCNAIAAEVLIPSGDFEAQIQKLPANAELASEEQFDALARRYGVSRESTLRCLLDRGRVGQAFYDQKARSWAAQQKKSSGGNYYNNQGAYISRRFAHEVIGRQLRSQISVEHASTLLGIKPKSYARFEERVMGSAET